MSSILGGLAFLSFGSFFLLFLLSGVIDLIGKVYVTFRVLSRDDLILEQRIIYILISWFIPFGWVVYLLLGTERTAELFSDL